MSNVTTNGNIYADNNVMDSKICPLAKIYNKSVPVWEKTNLTLEEAAAYSGVGINRLRRITDNPNCGIVLWVGSKRLIKRKRLDEYLDKSFSI